MIKLHNVFQSQRNEHWPNLWTALPRAALVWINELNVLCVINRLIEHGYISTDWANKAVTSLLLPAPDLWPHPCLNTLPSGCLREQSEVKKNRIVKEMMKEETKDSYLCLSGAISHLHMIMFWKCDLCDFLLEMFWIKEWFYFKGDIFFVFGHVSAPSMMHMKPKARLSQITVTMI